ncbi:hypothetical protein ACWNYG_00865 [Candidatus Karelsulcia muelleri]|uniref:hypothetical protein n=1 Tax=Candidatus Karelsulcia muelleri TaxID=336810 RepID=UPI001950156E|nr:hypothetical protein [Candidatus Karelsulcia muelleri]
MKKKISLYIFSENTSDFNQRIVMSFNKINLEIKKNISFKKDEKVFCILEIECVVENILKIIIRLFKIIGINAIYYCI